MGCANSRRVGPGVPLRESQWAHSGQGKLINGQTQCNGGGYALFKQSQALGFGSEWRMRVDGGTPAVGFAGRAFDVVKLETCKSTARLVLHTGSTLIYSDASLDGEEHCHDNHLHPLIPKAPYDLALRCDPDGNVPQVQFNEDGLWHDFAPNRVALKAGPWFPYLRLERGHPVDEGFGSDRISYHRVHSTPEAF